MARIAFVFPGQGSQKVGMGKDAYDGDAAARLTFEAADRALDTNLSRLCFEGPEAELQLTANTQPAILTTSIALLRALDERPDAVAGHSLGEWSANVASGALDFERAVRLVRARGAFMQDAVPVGAGAMAAVMGGDRAAIEAACRDAGGVVEPVNYNSPGQIVVAGAKDAVERASGAIKGLGAKVIPLPVSAPFHSSLMRPAEERLRPLLAETPFADSPIPLYTNVDASCAQSGAALRDALERQVSRAVRWDELVRAMLSDGFTHFVEIGPGKVLTGLLGRIAKDTVRFNVQSLADVEPVRTALRDARR